MEADNSNIKYNFTLFIANLALILKLSSKITMNLNSVIACNKLLERLEKRDYDINSISSIIKKLFNTTSSNLTLLETSDIELFNLKYKKGKRNVKLTIISGIDIGEIYEYLDEESRILLWKYIKNLYVLSSKMIFQFNNGSDAFVEYIYKLTDKTFNPIKEFIENYPESNIINKEINPYEGVMARTGNLSVRDIIDTNLVEEVSNEESSITSLISTLGLENMINFEELGEKLKDMDMDELYKATENIKKFFGDQIDEGTSETIDLMLDKITKKLKGADLGKTKFSGIFDLAKDIGADLTNQLDKNKINPQDLQKGTNNMINNLMNSCKDKDGNPLMPQGFDPEEMAKKFMSMGNFANFANMMPKK